MEITFTFAQYHQLSREKHVSFSFKQDQWFLCKILFLLIEQDNILWKCFFFRFIFHICHNLVFGVRLQYNKSQRKKLPPFIHGAVSTKVGSLEPQSWSWRRQSVPGCFLLRLDQGTAPPQAPHRCWLLTWYSCCTTAPPHAMDWNKRWALAWVCGLSRGLWLLGNNRGRWLTCSSF